MGGETQDRGNPDHSEGEAHGDGRPEQPPCRPRRRLRATAFGLSSAMVEDDVREGLREVGDLP